MSLFYETKLSNAVAPAAANTNNTPWTTSILDTADFDQNMLVIHCGELADSDATFTVELAESAASNMAGSNPVADADMTCLESAASFTFAEDNKVRALGYIGSKRYIQATITPADNTGNAYLSAIWVQGAPRKAPVTQNA